MQVQIPEKSIQAFKEAAVKIGTYPELPQFPGMREDLAHYQKAVHMAVVIIEADKDGDLRDITNHSERKYEAWHYATDGYIPGSGGGFSYYGDGYDSSNAFVGARLTFNSSDQARRICEEHPELWEIIMLNVK